MTRMLVFLLIYTTFFPGQFSPQLVFRKPFRRWLHQRICWRTAHFVRLTTNTLSFIRRPTREKNYSSGKRGVKQQIARVSVLGLHNLF